MASVPRYEFAMTVKHAHQSAAFEAPCRRYGERPPSRNSRMAQGNRLTDLSWVIARVVEIKSGAFVLFPKLPVRRGEEISYLESSTVRVKCASFVTHVSSDRAIPTVRRNFDWPPQPVVGKSSRFFGITDMP